MTQPTPVLFQAATGGGGLGSAGSHAGPRGKRAPSLCSALLVLACSPAQSQPAAIGPAWDAAQIGPVLERTQRLHLAPDLLALSEGEQAAVEELLAAGQRLHRLFLQQRHPEALSALDYLEARPELAQQRDLFRLFSGPIATTLENTREAFLTVTPETPARNVYPPGTTREILDAFLAANPGRRDELLDDRTVVWAATPENARRLDETLDRYPALETLHPGLRARLQASEGYLAVPYSLAWAADMFFVYDRLNAAAGHVEEGDPAFARYLRLRARDLLADDYEGGDAAWVTGDFSGNLNAQIGAYETYDDPMYGVKTFFSLSILIRDPVRSDELQAALADIQWVEDALPYAHQRKVRSDIPVGVYNIVADFGQARGANTASILPNEAHLARQYGRIILMRGNILLNEGIFQEAQRAFAAAVVDRQGGDLKPEGGFYRTLWHEIGHYLGVDLAADGRSLEHALEDSADLFEELKADLVSLTAARVLQGRGRHSEAQLSAIHAAGINRVLQKNPPRRDQPYGTMQLIQWNWFLDTGVLNFEDGRLRIDYERYPGAVEGLLREVLALQHAGDRAAANAFVDRWTVWRPEVHGVIASRMRDSERNRFNLVTYEALDGPAR